MTLAIYVLAGIGAVTVTIIAAVAIVLVTAMIAAAIGEDPKPPTAIRAFWVRGAPKYHGGGTARWASFGARLQNIKKLKTDDTTGVIKAIYAAERQLKSLRAGTAVRPTAPQGAHGRDDSRQR
jgi:hypothetical protein